MYSNGKKMIEKCKDTGNKEMMLNSGMIDSGWSNVNGVGDKDDYDVSSIRSDQAQFNLQFVRDSAHEVMVYKVMVVVIADLRRR